MNIVQKKKCKELKRKNIAEKALNLISEKGLSNFTMDEVAKEAGVSKGTLYLYFDSKDSLIITAFSVLIERLKKSLEVIIPENTSKEEKIRSVIKLYVKVLKEFPSNDLLRLFEILINSMHNKSRIKELTDLFREYYSQLFGIWEEFVPSKTAAIMLQAMFDGISIYKSVGVEFKEGELCETFEYIIGKITS